MNWKKRIVFKDLLEEYNDQAEDELEEITRVKPLWIERFKTIPELQGFVKRIEKIQTETQFNRFLNLIYDYCDNNSIWVE
jgi:hypothetical protein